MRDAIRFAVPLRAINVYAAARLDDDEDNGRTRVAFEFCSDLVALWRPCFADRRLVFVLPHCQNLKA